MTGNAMCCLSFPCSRWWPASAGGRYCLFSIVAALCVGAYAGSVLATLAALHPLEYVAMNVLVGGTRGAYDKFELDYWSAAATEALRRLQRRLDYDASLWPGETGPRLLSFIRTREERAHPLLRRARVAG